MAYYENLPVYKKAMELTVYIEKIVRKFSRYHKYTIVSEFQNLSRSLASLIIRANSVREKLLLLTELRDRSEEMKQLIVIGKEVKAFGDFRQFQYVAGLGGRYLQAERGVA